MTNPRSALSEVLGAVLAPAPLARFESPEALFAFHRSHAEAHAPIDAAILTAARVDRPAFAFAAGYAEALRALVPGLPPGATASMAVTEAGPPHPRAVTTRVERGEGAPRLVGRKGWVTLADASSLIFVLAKDGEEAGRPRLRLVRVRADAPGVSVRALPPAPFVPEIHHGEVLLEGVPFEAEGVLPGDGWDDYVKPFRTVEDVHVVAAFVAHVLATLSRARVDHEVRERLAAHLTLARSLALEPPSSPEVHVVLAGLFPAVQATFDASEGAWAHVDDEVRSRYQRDRALLAVASKARAARRDKAWSRIDGTERGPRGLTS